MMWPCIPCHGLCIPNSPHILKSVVTILLEGNYALWVVRHELPPSDRVVVDYMLLWLYHHYSNLGHCPLMSKSRERLFIATLRRPMRVAVVTSRHLVFLSLHHSGRC
jgi:hypothetical protein